MPASAALILSVGSYLRFELSHNYRPGAESVHWTLKQFNGSAEPMIMPLYGGIEIMEPLIKHLTHEMNYYAPPVEQSIAIPNLSPAQRELQRVREQNDALLQNDVLPQHIQVDSYKNGVHVNIRLENRHAISYEGTMFIPKCPPGAFNFGRPLHNNLSLSEFTARFQPLFELFAYMVEDSVV
jgi:hypothetical protein